MERVEYANPRQMGLTSGVGGGLSERRGQCHHYSPKEFLSSNSEPIKRKPPFCAEVLASLSAGS